MIDLDERLHAAGEDLVRSVRADRPPLTEIHRRATARRMRRRVASATSVVLVVLVAGGVVFNRVDRGRDAAVHTVSDGQRPDADGEATGGEAAPPEVADRGQAGANASSAPAVKALPKGDDAAPVPARRPGPAPQAQPSGVQPPAEGCNVHEATKNSDPIVGSDPGDRVGACEYQATSPGGYRGSGAWTLDIVRNGQRSRIDSKTAPQCAAIGFVQPGDWVYVHLGWDDGFPGSGVIIGASELWVGSDQHC